MNPRHAGAPSNVHSELMKKRQTGSMDAPADRTVQHEDNRREVDIAAAVAAAIPLSAPQVFGGGAAKPPVIPPIGPDRLHKDAPSYVVVSHDHPTGEDPVPNPGYAPVGRASTIKDGLARAIYHQQTSGGRVVLWIWGGDWTEDLTLDRPKIDILGANRPNLIGHATIGLDTAENVIQGMSFTSPDALPAMDVLDGPQTPDQISGLQFIDSQFYGATRAWRSQRRIFMDRCQITQTQQQDLGAELPAAEFRMNFIDQDFSLVRNTQIRAFRSPDPISLGWQYPGFAVKATDKVLNPSINGGYFRGRNILHGGIPLIPSEYPNANCGVIFQHCEIYGCALNEGWNVVMQHCTGHSGFPAPDRRGGIFLMNRGWSMTGPDFDGAIPGYTFLEHTIVNSAYIGRFIADSAQTPPYSWGGSIWCRDVTHTSQYDGAPKSPFVVISGTGKIYIVDSITACTGWPTAGLGANYVINSIDQTSMGVSSSEAAIIMLDWVIE